MILKFSAPGKTFLIGEYGVLEGGACLLVSTGPRFEMSIETPGEGLAGGIHPSSPAGRWIRSHLEDFNAIKMSFFDPHHEAGGFGASSAQFLFVNLWSQAQRQNLQTLMSNLSIERVWQDFRELYLDLPESQRPSGGDIVSQWKGGLTAFQPKPFSAESLRWPKEQLEFALVRTRQKVATHLHLEQVKNKDYTLLKKISSEALHSLRQKDVAGFITHINGFAKALETSGLVALPTQELLSRFRGHSSVLAAKGCGALGADVIAVFYEPKNSLEVLSFLKAEGFAPQSTSNDLSEGLKISVDVNRDTFKGLRIAPEATELKDLT